METCTNQPTEQSQLRIELEKRGYSTRGKRKAQLEREFDDLRKGISNVPALLQRTPQATLERGICNRAPP